MTNTEFWRTFFGRSGRESALVTIQTSQDRAGRPVEIDRTWYANDRSQVMLSPGVYGSLAKAVRSIRRSGQQADRFMKDGQGWYCAVFSYAGGVEYLYGIDLRNRCIVNRGHVPGGMVKVVQSVTMTETRTIRR